MPTYEVIYEGICREVYLVDAESEAEAREKWSDSEPIASESIDGGVTEVRLSD